MAYELRPYQKRAVARAVAFLKSERKSNGIIILPTGSGKSLVIAGIASALDAPTLVFQPSKEILEQNYAKYCSYGFSAGIWSASVGRKQLSMVTFATIGSVRTRPELFKDFRYVIVDECHFVNAKGGMYRDFLKAIGKEKANVLGLTATPYRLTTDGFGGSILKFLTRTRPRIFRDVVYAVQNRALFDAGYLAKLQYVSKNGFDRGLVKINTTGADYDERALQRYFEQIDFAGGIIGVVNDLLTHRSSVLVFTRFIKEAERMVKAVLGSAIVTGETPKKERERVLADFRSGAIRAVANVGVLTTGFDYPELDTVVLARPTMSLALYYQMIGRSIRPHPQKDHALVVDLCGNHKTFGPVEDLRLVDQGNGKWVIESRGKQLTNIYFGQRF